jgi:hypothetical protein
MMPQGITGLELVKIYKIPNVKNFVGIVSKTVDFI